MKKFMTAFMVLSLVLGGVALAAAADVPQVSKSLDLSKLQKITDQEAQQLRGTGGAGFMNAGVTGICSGLNCQSYLNNYSNNHLYGAPGPHKVSK